MDIAVAHTLKSYADLVWTWVALESNTQNPMEIWASWNRDVLPQSAETNSVVTIRYSFGKRPRNGKNWPWAHLSVAATTVLKTKPSGQIGSNTEVVSQIRSNTEKGPSRFQESKDSRSKSWRFLDMFENHLSINGIKLACFALHERFQCRLITLM